MRLQMFLSLIKAAARHVPASLGAFTVLSTIDASILGVYAFARLDPDHTQMRDLRASPMFTVRSTFNDAKGRSQTINVKLKGHWFFRRLFYPTTRVQHWRPHDGPNK